MSRPTRWQVTPRHRRAAGHPEDRWVGNRPETEDRSPIASVPRPRSPVHAKPRSWPPGSLTLSAISGHSSMNSATVSPTSLIIALFLS